MKVVAPGKLVLTGAYAVLAGAPAVVVAVDRHAVADTRRDGGPETSREVRFAFGSDPAPHVDDRALFDGDRKLGLGSSAASVVAALATRRAARGEDLYDPDVRSALFVESRAAHARAQGGGSGVDVAASVYGGALRYELGSVVSMRIPLGLRIVAFASGRAARTSELRAKVEAFRVRDPEAFAEILAHLRAASEHGARAFERGVVDSFVMAAHSTRHGLVKLGALAGVPIVPREHERLSACAAIHGAAFLPSGAGGGDVSVYLGRRPPPPELLALASEAGLARLDLQIDHEGVRVMGLQARRAS